MYFKYVRTKKLNHIIESVSIRYAYLFQTDTSASQAPLMFIPGMTRSKVK